MTMQYSPTREWTRETRTPYRPTGPSLGATLAASLRLCAERTAAQTVTSPGSAR